MTFCNIKYYHNLVKLQIIAYKVNHKGMTKAALEIKKREKRQENTGMNSDDLCRIQTHMFKKFDEKCSC